MITRDNHTREQLNQAARERLKADGALPDRGVQVARREYARGDRVITRRNDRHRDVDNGTLATVIEIDGRTHRMLLETDFGQKRELDLAYVSQRVEHAYALTAGAQGATVTWAAVIGRPKEFTREWAYTAFSRAREQTALHVIGEHPHQDQEREHYAPSPGDRGRGQTLVALHRAMERSELEMLALEQRGADEALAHALTRRAGSMKIITRRSAQAYLQSPGGPPLAPRVAPTRADCCCPTIETRGSASDARALRPAVHKRHGHAAGERWSLTRYTSAPERHRPLTGRWQLVGS
jgi:hypothetical protein